jgi:peroxiredoxin
MDEIETAGAQLIAIGSGHAGWARDFIEEQGVEFPVFVDPGVRSYEHFGMKRGLGEVLTLRSLRHAGRAIGGGHRQSPVRGDGLQNGGVVVIDRNGDVVYKHVEQETGDLADLNEVIAALH